MKEKRRPFEPDDNEARMEAYILRQLTERERDEIAARLFEDDDTFDALRDAEAGLHDRYARGELSEADCSAYLEYVKESDSAHRQRFARALQQRPRRAAVAPRWLAIAACAITAAGASLWFARTPRTEPSTPAATSVSAPPSFVVAPGILRGNEDGVVIRVPPAATEIRLEFALEVPWPGGPFELEIADQGGSVMRETRELPAGARSISVALSIPPGRYTAVLTRPPAAEAIADYLFTIR
jgi:hypothetical protein